MKYIYKILFIGALTLTLLTVSSCNKFLDVRPVGELPSDQLLKDAQGFESALFGAYASLNNKALYGEKLSHEMIEILAQYFHVSGNEFVTSLVKYDYSHSLVESAVNEVWGKMYKNISNVNNVIISLEKFSPESLRYYNIYKGEALGLRAFMHFDLLRLFLDGAQGDTQDVGIPYSTDFSLTPSAIVNADKVYELIEKDLLEAEELLLEDEQYISYPKVNPAEPFLRDRETHFNLYAVQATLARMYFHKGDYQNAHSYAKKVIDAGKHELLDKADVASGKFKGVLFPGEVIFGVYSTEYFKTVHDRFLLETSYFSYNLRDDIKSIYEKEEQGHDYRWEGFIRTPSTTARKLRFVKLIDQYQVEDREYQRPEGLIVGINMIRLPEMYYIAAESVLQDDPAQARAYFDEVLNSRGLTPLAERQGEASRLTVERITEERYKEFIGEGQTFFNYKRLNLDIKRTDGTTVPASKDIFVWPVPLDEKEYNNQ